VVSLYPRAFAAYNDGSIRRVGAKKISDKKNWGEASKGVAPFWLPLTSFAPGCELDDYRIACFLSRNGELTAYGVDSPVVDYSYFHQPLIEWMIDKLNTQQDSGPAEDMPALLAQAGKPRHALISIGATRYTAFGEQTFLALGDKIWVVLYPASRYAPSAIAQAIQTGKLSGDMSVLCQAVLAAPAPSVTVTASAPQLTPEAL
ncbi:MAG: DUF5718 family protein, partial [Shewanella sp.]